MSKGYVYILSNPSMPGLVKVGRTCRSVLSRAGELYQTGVPTPFVVCGSALSPDCVGLERMMHDFMHELRVNDDREFFACEPSIAISALDEMLLEQVSSFVCEYLEDYTLTYVPLSVDEGDLLAACQDTDAHPYELSGAVAYLSPAAVQDAVNKLRSKLSAKLRARREVSTAAIMPLTVIK